MLVMFFSTKLNFLIFANGELSLLLGAKHTLKCNFVSCALNPKDRKETISSLCHSLPDVERKAADEQQEQKIFLFH